VLIVDACRQGVSERLVNEAEVGVAAVRVPSGKGWRGTEILCTAAAKPAAAVGAAKPRDADPVTDGKPTGAIPEGIDDADYLMARCDVGALGAQIALGQVQVSPADAAAGDPYPDLPAKRRRHIDFSSL
jgi:hypothetical protein